MGRGLDIRDELVVPKLDLSKLDPGKIGDLIEEATAQNSVTVTVYRGFKGYSGIRHRREMHEKHAVVGQAPSVVLADIARMLRGLKPIYLAEAIRRSGGELVGAFPNLRVSVGYDYCAAQLSGTSVAVADTIALSSSTRSPAATDAATTLPWSTAQTTDTAPVTNPNASSGELTYGGLARAAAAYAHTVTGPASTTNTYTLSKTWTCSTTTTGVQLAGLFGGSAKASQGGSNTTNMLFLETSFTPTTLTGASSDQLALTWTVTI